MAKNKAIQKIIYNEFKLGNVHKNYIAIVKGVDLKNEDTAIFIGYCGVLDKIYIDQLYLLAKIENPFNYEIIEISSLAIGKIGFEFGFTEEELENKLNIKKLNTKMKHNALHDAEHQAEEFIKIMNYKND